MSDIDEGVALGAQLHAESIYSRHTYDVEHTTKFGLRVLVHPDHVLLFARDNGVMIGMLIGGIQELWFSPVRYAVDHIFYVRKDRRGTMAAYKLISAFEDWARDKGAKFFRPAITAGVNGAAVRLYKGLGYKELGPILEKDL